MKKITMMMTFLLMSLIGMSQQFLPRVFGVSESKTAYIFKTDGTKITCQVKNLSWKKGNIDAIKVVDLEGNVIKLLPTEISHMYLPPSGLNKLGSTLDFMDDPSKWGTTDLDKTLLGEKLAYYEQSACLIKKKTLTLMMQVVNPTFCTKIRVYGDLFAEESVTGEEKSYYVKKNGDAAAHLLERSNYEAEFKILFADCPAVLEKFGANVNWRDFDKHVWEYDQACK